MTLYFYANLNFSYNVKKLLHIYFQEQCKQTSSYLVVIDNEQENEIVKQIADIHGKYSTERVFVFHKLCWIFVYSNRYFARRLNINPKFIFPLVTKI